MNETWKTIKINKLYQVSNQGRIRNIKTHKVLKLDNSTEYTRIQLYDTGSKRNYSVHRLVAEAFIVNTHSREYINHRDRDKRNNHVDNLEWVTVSENMIHMYQTTEDLIPKTKKIYILIKDNKMRFSGNSRECAEYIKKTINSSANTKTIARNVRASALKTNNGYGYVIQVI